GGPRRSADPAASECDGSGRAGNGRRLERGRAGSPGARPRNEGTVMSSLARRIERLEQAAVDVEDLVRELGAAEELGPEEIEEACRYARDEQQRIRATPDGRVFRGVRVIPSSSRMRPSGGRTPASSGPRSRPWGRGSGATS